VSADGPDPSQAPGGDSGFARVALHGTAWAVGQLVLNKAATVLATWVIARCLTASEFAAAAVALTSAKFLTFLPPLNMGDVLIARRSRLSRLRDVATRIALSAGVLVAVVGIASSPLLASQFDAYPTGLLVGLISVCSLKVVGEALQVRPLTEMRVAFRNRAIATIDGTVQLACTGISVALAILGCGAWSVVVPPSLVAFGRASAYRVVTAASDGGLPAPPAEQAERRELFVGFAAAGGAQYLHCIVDTMPLLLLGRLSSAEETGYFAFALALSSQANSLVSSQVSSVLQPVFGGLAHDPQRQVRGFLRALATLSAIAVPICLLQALFGSTLFRLAFDDRWQPAAQVFAAQSILEAVFFACAPTMAILKAQGRFRTFLAWQLTHLVVSTLVVGAAAMHGGALWVAVSGAALWFLSLPIAVWLSIRPAGLGLLQAVGLFAAPWASALPIAVVGWLLLQSASGLGRVADALSLGLLAPLLLLTMLYATRWSQPAAFSELSALVRNATARARGLLLRRS
jgi:O-antigen/teichoic acid export membrane protein